MNVRFRFAIVLVILLSPAVLAEPFPVVARFEVTNAEIHQTLRDLAKAFHANIAMQPGIDGSVTGSFVNCSLDEILTDLLPQVGASHCVAGTVVMVGSPGRVSCEPSEALRRPFVGPRVIVELVPAAEIAGSPPEAARPDRAPYFGRREAGMPSTHFMDPRIPVAEPEMLPR